MTAYTFYTVSMIRGYGELYWTANQSFRVKVVDGDLLCEREIGNSHDPQVMAIKR